MTDQNMGKMWLKAREERIALAREQAAERKMEAAKALKAEGRVVYPELKADAPVPKRQGRGGPTFYSDEMFPQPGTKAVPVRRRPLGSGPFTDKEIKAGYKKL